MITIITEERITKDGVSITPGMKVWLDAWIAGVVWAEVDSIDWLGQVRINWSPEYHWDVSPKELFVSEAAAVADWRSRNSDDPTRYEVES